MVLYIENPNKSTRRLLDLINEFGKPARYKNQFYFYTQAMNTRKRKFKKAIPFTVASKRMK